MEEIHSGRITNLGEKVKGKLHKKKPKLPGAKLQIFHHKNILYWEIFGLWRKKLFVPEIVFC